MTLETPSPIAPLPEAELAAAFRAAKPFPFFCIDDFAEPDFAARLAASFPGLDEAARAGRLFRAVNEDRKVQITERERFPEPIRVLSQLLESPEFVARLSRITGIPGLVPDPLLAGGGMHVMGSGGRLDVHVDFNLIEERGLHRRLNILVFLNEEWRDDWGGQLELWDPRVKSCAASFLPKLGRCVVFQTSEASFHGVAKVRCPPGVVRKSFAAYYYTREAPPGWDGKRHSTVFKARPNERLRGAILMPGERLLRSVRPTLRRIRAAIRR